MARRRCCACRNTFTSPGRTTKRCAWTPTPASRPVSFISATGRLPRGCAHAAGRFGGPVGNAARGRPRPVEWIAEGDDIHLKAGYLRKNGVPYSENASLDGVLRFGQGAQRGSVDGGHHRHDRSDVSARAFIISSHFKKQAERHRMESHGVLGKMVRRGNQKGNQT